MKKNVKREKECSNKGKVEAPLNYGKKREGLKSKKQVVIMVNLYL